MRVALLSGYGPTFKNDVYCKGTLFDGTSPTHVETEYFASRENFSLRELSFTHNGVLYPLLRPLGQSVPHLTTLTLSAILQEDEHDVYLVDTAGIWAGSPTQIPVSVDVVLLSTSFIWDMKTLALAMNYCAEISDGVPIILGGQYANLRFEPILHRFPEIAAIVRGDAEEVLRDLLRKMARGDDFLSTPNLAFKALDGTIKINKTSEIDFVELAAPAISGRYEAVPYESMRGCPFKCGFCSFPFASPHWRYRSATRIVEDWASYTEANGAKLIKAMDSTFTVPPRRMDELMDLLPPLKVNWEAYSRANFIKNDETVDRLLNAGCRTLSIGFESMSERTLESMVKKVTASQNRRAFEHLKKAGLGYRCSFMVGYPGETPADFQDTHDFLVNDYEGHFTLHVFGMTDEAMPVWRDRARTGLTISDEDDPDFSWSHEGMNAAEARALNHNTLDAVRKSNTGAVLHIWQDRYQRYLIPSFNRRENLKIEKLVEMIAMLPRDYPNQHHGLQRFDELLADLAAFGVARTDPATHNRSPLVSD
ncbi:radical SAM superfamily enzyme YgiQ (UPF0313 family) [Agrobacterium tumefaciens]|uniref:Radical SAM superfamily enzyme YgiQ (UPF0313 family) n=1 Tax=Agrobacterium radiobacter TaxID=362 RepID=A0ABR6JCE2_AGRRD|nr:radical SAM protein [Agrobacterium radiobacter]MBB4320474.1 radical SAM superfamily enzyme YgiQ (UPF0313 family) [Agrobacterium radiobacter]MBB4337139.1 radical SAM superfamily enzyme YgiQ (UPF0313 family) [Agrobacterium radiobacter]MBB4492613.1 radical SAM superfamily enzyme YgiQ (UPF0313 family) [Agrobacterium radiobacter]MBB4497511.1 radical SAM superfamily enzyme YgiQ (UPF0313 family) [Agrobacterium radiobacter]MBB4502578.1 radical SAM superfamily enzyme YgiQ (UPF0313 family) [Agrobacte